jgi:hypothetical protein
MYETGGRAGVADGEGWVVCIKFLAKRIDELH